MAKSTKLIVNRPPATKLPKAAAVSVTRSKPAKNAMSVMKASKAGKSGKGC